MYYRVTVNHLVYENVKEYATRDEARLDTAAMRKVLAEKMKVDLFDLWFDVEEVSKEVADGEV
jgi:hypothetical protein